MFKASFLDENSKQNKFEHGAPPVVYDYRAPPGVISVFYFTLQSLRNQFLVLKFENFIL